MAQQIVATQGNFAQVANRIFGTDFEEIDFSYPKDAYVPGNGVDVARSELLEREAHKTERNIERAKKIANEIKVYEILGLNNYDKIITFGKALVDSGYKFFIMPGRMVFPFGVLFAVPAEARKSDDRWQNAVNVAGLRGQLVRAEWLPGGDITEGARVITGILGLQHPAWAYGRGWLITPDDKDLWPAQPPNSPVYWDPEYLTYWGAVVKWMGCLPPPPGQPTQCNAAGKMLSLLHPLPARTKVIYYVPDQFQVGPNPPGGIPVPQPGPVIIPSPPTGPGTPPVIDVGYDPYKIDQQKILLIGGIALLAFMGIILLVGD